MTDFGEEAIGGAVTIDVVVIASACLQETVQEEELDVVIGRDRGTYVKMLMGSSSKRTILNPVVTAPTLDDYNSLPQVQVFMMECLH